VSVLVQGIVHSAVRTPNDLDVWILSQYLQRAVGRAAVNHDMLDVRVSLSQYTLNGFSEIAGAR